MVFKKKFKFNSLNLYKDQSIDLSAIVMGSDLSFRNTSKWFNFTISPNPLSPKIDYALHLVARFNTLDEVNEYAETLESKIEAVLAQIGDENAIST